MRALSVQNGRGVPVLFLPYAFRVADGAKRDWNFRGAGQVNAQNEQSFGATTTCSIDVVSRDSPNAFKNPSVAFALRAMRPRKSSSPEKHALREHWTSSSLVQQSFLA